jgi:hypothetical protein
VLFAGACTNTTLDLFDPDLGLLAHWALDESEPGGLAVDSSGFSNDGTPSANPPVPAPDVPPVRFADPYSLSFNGQDQWIEMGNPALLNIGGPTTMAAWVRPVAIDGLRNVVGHGYVWTPDHDFALRINAGNYIFTTWDGSDHAAVAPIPAADVGAWVHLCGVFDGSTYYVYRNGALAASTADPTMPPANINAIWAIGARAPQLGGSLDYPLQGQIDDVRIYGRALSAAEVEVLYRR